MATEGLVTLVVGYHDVGAARGDYEDLVTARRENRVGAIEAAVVHQTGSGHELVVTTVDPRSRWTLRVMGLGVVAGAVLAPAFAGVLLGGGVGAIAGELVDRIDAFNHGDMREVERLVDDSTANLIVVSDAATADAIAEVGRSRGRVVLPFSSADVDLLKREVQRNPPPSGLCTDRVVIGVLTTGRRGRLGGLGSVRAMDVTASRQLDSGGIGFAFGTDGWRVVGARWG